MDFYRDCKCPYFETFKTKAITIYCDRENSVSFKDQKELKNHMKAHCCSIKGYPKCTIAAELEEFYDPVSVELERREHEGWHRKH